MSHYRIEVYSPLGRGELICARQTWDLTDRLTVARWLETALPTAPGTTALVLEVGAQGDAYAQDEDLVERWRVAPDGRVLRQRCQVYDFEHEVAPRAQALAGATL